MWSVYGPAIEELFSSLMSAGEAATLAEILSRVRSAARQR
jgi:hypothetical protein